MFDKIKKEILIVEIGITSFENLRAVEVGNKHKYDLLANHVGALNKVKTKIVSYVMTWDGLVTTYHRGHRKDINIDNRIQAYVQTKVLKMTLESLSMEARRGDTSDDIFQEVSKPSDTLDSKSLIPFPASCESNN
jgi:hypothetical protein